MAVRFALLPAAALLLSAALPAADEPDALAADEQALRAAKLPTDGPGLLAFFKARTPSDADREKLAATVRRLGDESFEVREQATRELIARGRSAVPFLRPALRDPDPEIARRAARCLEAIAGGNEPALAASAARLVAARKPDGAAAALLAYLPAADDETTEEAVLQALAAVGVRDGKPESAVVAALADRQPMRRAGAAMVLGKAVPKHRPAVRRLLTDADARVRFHAAAALVQVGEKEAVPVLAALLADAPVPVAYRAEDLLGRIAGEAGPAVALAPAEETRRRCRAAWDDWWKKHRDKTDLAKVKWEQPLLGLHLVCNCDVPQSQIGSVWECGPDGKTRWQVANLGNPSDVQLLPGGRFLVAEFQGRKVTERDRAGKVLWTFAVDNYPNTCRRLPNGNTLIATYGEVTEVTPEGKRVFSHRGQASIYRAQRLRNGHTLFACSSGHIVELDAAGKEVRRIPVPGGISTFGGVEALPNGRFLVSVYGSNKVLEIDAAGKAHWEASVQTPGSAARLPTGNTLVASMDAKQIVEIDRAGKVVWKLATPGRPFLVLRR
ncbi:MAG TPA: HEAT repeat domain-containing protein [Gemmataceae bacterium]|nr:HEAT repeat domain-containing protein [Gemmataceae bacterium]